MGYWARLEADRLGLKKILVYAESPDSRQKEDLYP